MKVIKSNSWVEDITYPRCVVQVSFDLDIPEYMLRDINSLIEDIGGQIEGLHGEIGVLGGQYIEDMTDIYKNMYGIDVNSRGV